MYTVNRNKKHPLDESRPLIYWDIALLLIPPQLGGNNVGAILSKIFPDSATMILALLVTFYAVYLTIKKGRHLYELETDAVEHCGKHYSTNSPESMNCKLLDGIDEENENLNSGVIASIEHGVAKDQPVGDSQDRLSTRIISKCSTHSVCSNTSNDPMLSGGAHHMAYVDTTQREHSDWSPQAVVMEENDGSVALIIEHADRNARALSVASNASKCSVISISADLIHEASKHGHVVTNSEDRVDMIVPVFSIFLLLLSLLFFILVNISMTLISKCSTLYWVFFASSYPILVVCCYYIIEYLSDAQVNNPESVLYGDVNVTQDKLSRPIMSFLIGITCSLLGIGGGELFGPFLLSMKVLPQVSSATTSIMSMISSCNNIIHHMVLGSFPYESAGILFLVGAVGGTSGRIGALHITKLFGRPSLLIFILAVILSASGCILIGEFIEKKEDFELSNVCA